MKPTICLSFSLLCWSILDAVDLQAAFGIYSKAWPHIDMSSALSLTCAVSYTDYSCGDHTMRRALEEAFDLNTYANEGNPRLKGRGASFCMERSGYQEAGLNDQVSYSTQQLNFSATNYYWWVSTLWNNSSIQAWHRLVCNKNDATNALSHNRG